MVAVVVLNALVTVLSLLVSLSPSPDLDCELDCDRDCNQGCDHDCDRLSSASFKPATSQPGHSTERRSLGDETLTLDWSFSVRSCALCFVFVF